MKYKEHDKLFAHPYYSQTSLQMPFKIQARMAQTIDAAIDKRVNPLITAVHSVVAGLSEFQATIRNEYDALLASQGSSIIQTIEDQSQKTLNTIQNQTLENLSASTTVQAKLEDLSAGQYKSTDLVIRRVIETGRSTVEAIQRQTRETYAHTSSFHQKLDQMNSLIGTVKDVMGDHSTAQKCTGLGTSNSGIREAAENILCSI